MLYFVYHWLHKVEQDWFTSLGSILGTHWTKEKIAALSAKQSEGGSDEFTVPLSLVIRPSLIESLSKKKKKRSDVALGDYKPQEGEQIDSMADWTPEQYRSFIEGNRG